MQIHIPAHHAPRRRSNPRMLILTGLFYIISSSAALANPLGVLLAANENEGSLSVIDPKSGVRLAKIEEGGFAGHEVASSPDGRFAYVPIYGDGNAGTPGTDGREVVKIDLVSKRIVGRLAFDHGVRPHAAVFNPRDGLLYVTTELDRTISIIDPKTMTLVGAIPTGQALSHMMAISHDGRFGYVSNIEPGGVSVLDLKTRRLIGVIPVAAKIQRIALSADDQTIFTNDQTSARVAVIDVATRKVTSWIPLPAVGMGLTTTADGRWLLVASEPTSELMIVDLNARVVAHRIVMPQYPHETVIGADGLAYVSCSLTGKIIGVRMRDWTIQRTMKSGLFVNGLAWATAQGR